MDCRWLFNQSVLRQIEWEHDQQRLHVPQRCRHAWQLHKAWWLQPDRVDRRITAAPSRTGRSSSPQRGSAGHDALLEPINICISGTDGLHQYAEQMIPREPREDDDAYNRRIFHATLPPFCSA